MAGITIIDVKVVGLCSKHRKDDSNRMEAPRDRFGNLVTDKDICCFGCMIIPDKEQPPQAKERK